MGNYKLPQLNMRFALALACIAVAVIAKNKKAVIAKGVNFENSLNSRKEWGNFKKKTSHHSGVANGLMKARNVAVVAWFKAKAASGSAETKAHKAAMNAKAKGGLRNSAIKVARNARNHLSRASAAAKKAKKNWATARSKSAAASKKHSGAVASAKLHPL